ncbi:hypothetical protein [Legionella yabuuchiae]|uniref:hypothetical protein n=1 Tax=Legionella yabuuchiae TaxID=376727 RepID=UPI0010543CF4|nr:hypothetical protein [Legionella yabuuchiae]
MLEQINQYRFGKDDIEMERFVAEKKAAILNANTKDEIAAIQSELDSMHKQMNKNPAIAYIREAVESFRKNAGIFTVGMNKKADRIESAMRNVPIAERGNINEGKTQQARNVLLAMASHRHLHRSSTPSLEENKAANTFVKFKDKFKNAVKISNEQEQQEKEELNVRNDRPGL